MISSQPILPILGQAPSVLLDVAARAEGIAASSTRLVDVVLPGLLPRLLDTKPG